MKYFIISIIVLLTGCSGAKIADEITDAQIAMSGNKPPAFFRVVNEETMEDYIFHTEDFSFQFPTAKPSDFTDMGGWSGMSMNDEKTIAFGFKNSVVYHIAVSTSGNILKYSEKSKAIENHNEPYIRARYHKYHPDTKVSIKKYGRENYDCIIIEDKNYNKWNKKDVTYSCYKFDSAKTKVKQVSISLTHNKPKDPKLAKEYTYEDLKRRAKRTLDSLYIKDGW